jgi:molybdopterin-guanine dinucleotide biosynthesis protein A
MLKIGGVMNNPQEQPTLAVLAGGAGSRMGQPKSLLQIQGRPILEMILGHCDWRGPTLLVTSPKREHPPGWKMFQHEAVDEVGDQGPLRGLMTALRACRTRWLIAITVDMPSIAREHLDWLCEQACCMSAPKCGLLLGIGERIEPFPSMWRNDCASVIESILGCGGRSMRGLVCEPWVSTVQTPAEWPAEVWTNLNCPEDLRGWVEKTRFPFG